MKDNLSEKMARKRKYASDAWVHFELDNVTQKALCKVQNCGACIICKFGGKVSTSSLWAHLNVKHGIVQKDKKQKVSSDLNSHIVLNSPLTASIAKYILNNRLPLSTVENSDFRDIISKIPQSQQLSTKKLKTLLQSLVHVVTQNTVETFKNHFVSLTTDCWTSNSAVSFVALSVHYIDKDWKLQKRHLSCTKLSGKHTAINIGNHLLLQQRKFIPDNKVVTIVTDNASNMVALGDDLPYKRLGCIAHGLELVTGAALEERSVANVLKRVRSIVAHFKRSTQAMEALRDSAGSYFLTPQQDVRTRWWSSFEMLKTVVYLQPWMQNLKSEHLPTAMKLTPAEYELIEHIISTLKSLVSAQKELEGDTYVSASLVRLHLEKIAEELIHADTNDTETIKSLKEVMMQKLRTRYFNQANKFCGDTLYNVIQFLDPRLKSTFFTPTELSEVKMFLINQVSTPETVTPAYSAETVTNDETEVSEVARFLSSKVGSNRCHNGISSNLDVEIANYLSVALSRIESDPLLVWKTMQNEYPKLAGFARKYLCIPATSASSERMFSSAGLTITKLRNRLTPDSASMLMFLRENWASIPQQQFVTACKLMESAESNAKVINTTSSSSVVDLVSLDNEEDSDYYDAEEGVDVSEQDQEEDEADKEDYDEQDANYDDFYDENDFYNNES
jgi:hypothetical protein